MVRARHSLRPPTRHVFPPNCDEECHRTLARTVDFEQEFDTHDIEIIAACYSIESSTSAKTQCSRFGVSPRFDV